MQANVPELVSWGPHSSLETERKIGSRSFYIPPPFTKREIIGAVKAKKCTNKCDAPAELLFSFANLYILLFGRFRYRCRC